MCLIDMFLIKRAYLIAGIAEERKEKLFSLPAEEALFCDFDKAVNKVDVLPFAVQNI